MLCLGLLVDCGLSVLFCGCVLVICWCVIGLWCFFFGVVWCGLVGLLVGVGFGWLLCFDCLGFGVWWFAFAAVSSAMWLWFSWFAYGCWLWLGLVLWVFACV